MNMTYNVSYVLTMQYVSFYILQYLISFDK